MDRSGDGGEGARDERTNAKGERTRGKGGGEKSIF